MSWIRELGTLLRESKEEVLNEQRPPELPDEDLSPLPHHTPGRGDNLTRLRKEWLGRGPKKSAQESRSAPEEDAALGHAISTPSADPDTEGSWLLDGEWPESGAARTSEVAATADKRSEDTPAEPPITKGRSTPLSKPLERWSRLWRRAPEEVPEVTPTQSAPSEVHEEQTHVHLKTEQSEDAQLSLLNLDWNPVDWTPEPLREDQGSVHVRERHERDPEPSALTQGEAWRHVRPNLYERTEVVTGISGQPSSQDLADWNAAREMGGGRQLGRRPEHLEQALFNALHSLIGHARPVVHIDAQGQERTMMLIDEAAYARACAQLDANCTEELIFGSLLSARAGARR